MFARAGVRYPSCAIADGMRVVVNIVLFRMDRFMTAAAAVIAKPNAGPPIRVAAFEKYPVLHFAQSPRAASVHAVGNR